MRSLRGVTWFLDHGCDPNEVQSRSRETALHVAVNSGAGVPLVRLLVERGVDVHRRDAAEHRPRPRPRQTQDQAWQSSWQQPCEMGRP